MPLQILFVAPHLLADGPTRFVLDLAEILLAMEVGAEIFSIAPPRHRQVPHELPSTGVTYGVSQGMRRRYALPVMLARLLRAARRSSVVVASNEVGPGHTGAFLAGKLVRRPTVAIAQNNLQASLSLQPERVQRISRWAYPRFDFVACVSDGVVSTAVDLGVPASRSASSPTG